MIWANGSLLVVPSLRVLNLTRVDSSLVILAKGPGYVAYAVPRRPEPTPAQPVTATAAADTPRGTTTPASATAANPSPASNLTTQFPPVAGPPTTPTAVAATTPPPGFAPGQPPGWLLPLVAAAVAAGAAFLLLSTRRRRQQVDLGEVDAKVLEYVRRRGGAYEADVARELGIPRTTVFRAVRRLEERGLVRVEKREGRNWVAPAG